jgi:hypothetical protein
MTMHKMGSLTPVIYFRRKDGHIFLAPYSSFPTPPGCDKCEAGNLTEIDRLQDQLLSQERYDWDRDAQHEHATFDARAEQVRDNLYAKMTSAGTSQYEKDFIREYIKLRDERKREKWRTFHSKHAFLWAREFDTPGRRSDEERVDLDRMELPRG